MGLYLSIPLLPGVRLGGRLGSRHGRGLIASMFVGMGMLVWWLLLFEFYLLAGALLLVVAFYWLLFIVARYGVLTLLNQPAKTPGDAIRQMRVRIGAWRARR